MKLGKFYYYFLNKKIPSSSIFLATYWNLSCKKNLAIWLKKFLRILANLGVFFFLLVPWKILCIGRHQIFFCFRSKFGENSPVKQTLQVCTRVDSPECTTTRTTMTTSEEFPIVSLCPGGVGVARDARHIHNTEPSSTRDCRHRRPSFFDISGTWGWQNLLGGE
jgi:hypothetical protein